MNVALTGHDLDSADILLKRLICHNLAHLNCLSWSGIYSGWQNSTLCSIFYVDLISLNCLKKHHNKIMCGRPSERITNKCVKSIIIHGKMLSFSVIRFIHAVTMATCIFYFVVH